MSPIDQHTAIALAVGYTYEDRVITYDGEELRFRLWRTPCGGGMERSWPPNYPGDLNAMHEAEKVLCNQFTTLEESYWRNLSHVKPHPIYATAAQRAEAFLKTLGLWGDETDEAIIDPRGHEERSMM